MTAQAETGRGDDAYGFGFDVQSIHGHPIVGHGGGFPGISASFSVYPDDGYVVAVLSNYDMVARTVADRLRDWIVAETP
jgi:hypothetical protein